MNEREGNPSLFSLERSYMSLNLNYQPEVVVVTENLSREDWLNYRRLGIGGSGCFPILHKA